MIPSPVLSRPNERGSVAWLITALLVVVGFCLMVAVNSFQAKVASVRAESSATTGASVAANLVIARKATILHSGKEICGFEAREHDWFEDLYQDQLKYYGHTKDAAQRSQLNHFIKRHNQEKNFTFTSCMVEYMSAYVPVATTPSAP